MKGERGSRVLGFEESEGETAACQEFGNGVGKILETESLLTQQ